MAKPSPTSPAAAKTAKELKKELKRLMKAIVDGNDAKAEVFDEASRTLMGLRDLTVGASNSNSGNEDTKKKNNDNGVFEIPQHFLCPISSEIMKDPVILQSGQTYDRPFIQEWLGSGNRTCPKTQLVLTNLTLTPNHLVRTLISQWCTDHGFALPHPTTVNPDDPPITANDRNSVTSLLDTLSSSSAPVPSKKQAVKDLRLLTRQKTSVRAFIGQNPESISELLSVISLPDLSSDRELQEDVVTIILNLSIFESNKKILGDDPLAIPVLIHALGSDSMQTKSNSAAALFSLSALDSNKVKIGDLGAMRGLVQLLQNGTLEARKDAANAIFNLCTNIQNRSWAVREGVAVVLSIMIVDKILVGESLTILAMVSGHRRAAEEVVELGGLETLFEIIRESTCASTKENAVVILYSLCVDHRLKLKEVNEEEEANGTISDLVCTGTSRVRRKATGILEKLKRVTHNPHYSC